MAEKPNCYNCKYRGELPGNAHSRCVHPSVKPAPTDELLAALGVGMQTQSTLSAARELNVKGNATGIRRGWFIWPYNFDPVWLESCNGFTPKE